MAVTMTTVKRPVRENEVCERMCISMDFVDEERAIRAFLEDGDEASQFLDRSSRLFYNQKSHMKEAKKK